MAACRLLPILLLLAFVELALPDSPQPQPLGKLVDIGGSRIHLYCTGAGSPTVMIVGGGFSFDWGLVQPNVAQFTRVCTYDASGTAWSGAFPMSPRVPLCAERVEEIHKLLKSAAIDGPYVLVGFSIGGLFARLYAARYPEDVAGMVIVDHAFIDPIGKARIEKASIEKAPSQPRAKSVDSAGPLSVSQVDSPPQLISDTGMAFGIEDDQNFKKLPQLNQDLHLWAMSANTVRPTAEAAAECAATIDASTTGHPYPLADIPLVIVSTGNDDPNYGKLQTKLLSLSHNSQQLIANNSSHMVIVDQPEVIVEAVRRVVKAVRVPGSRK